MTPEQHRLLLARLQGVAETEKTLTQTARKLAEQNMRERQTDNEAEDATLPQTISLRSFLGQGITFTNENELNNWLEQLRSHLRAPLKEGRSVQVQP